MQSAPNPDDAPDPTLLHRRLVDELVRDGLILTPGVEAAFRAVPRHHFLPRVPVAEAYRDDAIVTKRQDGLAVSSSSQPAIMAIMLEQLQVRPGQRVLEVGAGTGYNAALLAHLAGEHGRVVSLDIDADTVAAARAHLTAAGIPSVAVVQADGGAGHAPASPYDRIIVTAGAWEVMPAWLEQLAPDGRIVVPLSLRGGVQRSAAFRRSGRELVSESLVDCGFMRLRGAFAGPEGPHRLGGEGALLSVDAPSADALAQAEQSKNGPYQTYATGVRATRREAATALTLWLAVHEAGFCTLTVPARPVGRLAMPCLLPFREHCATPGVLTAESLCLLVPEEGAAAGDDEPLPLFVRAHGPDRSVPRRVVDHIAAWDAIGRPGSGRLQLRSEPLSTARPPAPGEVVLLKRWTRLIARWREQ